MDKDTKRNITIAAVLAVAAVFVLWWMKPGAPVYVADPNSIPVPDATGLANQAATPGYMSYNVPPYDPGALPPITTYVGGSSIDNSTGKGCCPGCAGDDIGVTNNIGQYFGLMGPGALAGAA